MQTPQREASQLLTLAQRFKTLTPLLISPLLSISSLTHASESVIENTSTPLKEEILWLKEETYITTATKTLEDIKKSGATASVITEADLKNMGARNLMDALKRVPGLGIQTTSIGIPAIEVRGVKTDSSEKVLFLVNGHSVNNNLVNGGATWAYGDFQIDNIKRVEIIRGPGSALYGANAFVAIINIITKSANDISGTELTIRGGSNETLGFSASIGKESGDIELTANLNILDTDGVKEDVDSDSFGNSGETKDWQRHYDFSFSVDTANHKLQGKYSDRTSGPFIGIGNTLNDESKQDYIEYFLEYTFSKNLSDQLNIQTKVYFDHFEANNFWEIFPEGTTIGSISYPDGALGSPTVENEKTGAEFQLEYNLGFGHKLLAGVSFEHQTQFNVHHLTNFDPTGPIPDPQPTYSDVSDIWNWNGSHSRDTRAFYIQDIWDIDDTLRLIIGTRRDHYSDFGNSVNPRSSLTWEFIKNYNLTAVYGQAFRAPNFGELHNINNPAITGNEDLKPEEIETFEVALNGQINKRTHFQLTGFRNGIRNLISYEKSGSLSVSNNVGKLRVTGLEAELSSRLRNGSSVELNYTYQYPVNKLTNKREAGIPIHKANLAFNFHHSKYLNSYIGISHRGAMNRTSADPRDNIKENTTLDLAWNWKSESDNLEVIASIYNLFNEQYSDPSGLVASDLPAEGRNLIVEATYKL